MKKGGSTSMVKRRSSKAAPAAAVTTRASVDSHLSTRMMVSAVDIAGGLNRATYCQHSAARASEQTIDAPPHFMRCFIHFLLPSLNLRRGVWSGHTYTHGAVAAAASEPGRRLAGGLPGGLAPGGERALRSPPRR